MSVAQIPVHEPRILERLAEVVLVDLRIDVAIDLDDVGPAVVVVVDKPAAPCDIIVVDADAGVERQIGESSVAVVVIEVAGVVGEVGLEDIEPAVAVVVGHGHAHACLLVAVVVVGAAGHDGDIGKRAVVVVLEQDARLGVDRDIDVGPSVVVEVIRDCGDGVARARFQDAGLLGNIGEGPVAVVVVENVGVAGKAARAAHGGHALPLAEGRVIADGGFVGIELDEVADEKIEMAVAVVIEERAARAPAAFLLIEAGLAG